MADELKWRDGTPVTARMQAGTTPDDYRLAPSGEGPLADEWKDKKHRLVYDLAGEVLRLQAQVAQLTRELGTQKNLADIYGEAVAKWRPIVEEAQAAYRRGWLAGREAAAQDADKAAGECRLMGDREGYQTACEIASAIRRLAPPAQAPQEPK